MKIEGVCSECGAKHIRDCAQGETRAWFKCACGYPFEIMVIMEPYGLPFEYGIEALERKRWADACTHFMTSFEMFQRSATGLLLEADGVRPKLAALMVDELRLSRENLSTIAKEILGARPPSPTAGSRHQAVHKGAVPKPREAVRRAAELVNVFEGWLKPMSERELRDFDRLWRAYLACKTLPKDVSRSARRTFDLSVTQSMIKQRWQSYEAASLARTAAPTPRS